MSATDGVVKLPMNLRVDLTQILVDLLLNDQAQRTKFGPQGSSGNAQQVGRFHLVSFDVLQHFTKHHPIHGRLNLIVDVSAFLGQSLSHHSGDGEINVLLGG
jgi:hypothetical protein